MLSIIGLDNLKYILIEMIKIGQELPYEDPELIAEKMIKIWKRKIIKRVK